MTTKTVWAAYFSATNTTKKVVTQIARRLSQQTACPMEIYDFTHPQARKTPKAFAPGDLVVFGTPVYAGPVSYTHLDVYKRQKGKITTWALASTTILPLWPTPTGSCWT